MENGKRTYNTLLAITGLAVAVSAIGGIIQRKSKLFHSLEKYFEMLTKWILTC